MADEGAIRELMEKMEYERERLLAMLSALEEAEAGRPQAFSANRNTGQDEAEWTAKEQMVHLCLMEASYRATVERTLAEAGAPMGGEGAQPLPATMEDANLHPIGELLDLVAQERRTTNALIAKLRPEDYERQVGATAFGTMTVLQWLRSHYRHDRMHHDQIVGRESEYRPRWAGGVEPDQRTHRRTFAES